MKERHPERLTRDETPQKVALNSSSPGPRLWPRWHWIDVPLLSQEPWDTHQCHLPLMMGVPVTERPRALSPAGRARGSARVLQQTPHISWSFRQHPHLLPP